MIKKIINRFSNLSLKTKVILFIVLVAILPFAIVMAFLLNSLSHASLDVEGRSLNDTTILVKDDLLNIVGSDAKIYDITFKDMIIDVESLKESIGNESFNDKLLTNYYYKHQIISDVYFVNSSGSIFIVPLPTNFEQGENINISQIKEFNFLTSETENKYSGRWLGPYDDFKSQARIITYVLPIWQGSEFKGMVGFDIVIDNLFTEVVRIDPSQSSYIIIVKSNGDFISSSEKIYDDLKVDNSSSNIFDSQVIKDLGISRVFTPTGDKEGTFTITGDTADSQKIVAFSNIPSFGGKIAIVSPLSEIIQVQKEKASEIQQVVYRVGTTGFIYMIVISSLVVVTSFFLLQRGVSEPITKLKKGIEDIEKTDFKSKVEISIKSKDEIGSLASAFNQMTKSLRESRSKIEDYSKTLEKKVEDRTEKLNEKVDELTKTQTAIMNMMEDSDKLNKQLAEAQEKLNKNYKELQKLDVEKDEFISIAAHELKTPMTAVRGFSQLLQNEKVINDSEARNKYLKIIETELNRLSKLVTETLDLSRMDLGTMKFAIEEVDSYKMMDDIKENMTQRIKDKGMVLNFKLEKVLPTIVTDRERLKEILINLVDNAIKYSEKGSITVEAQKEGEYLKFSVSDTGIGIPEEHFDKIFKRFSQVESSLTRKVGGTGLGLSICKELVEALGGKIGFTSKFGVGTTFYFTLPMKYKEKIK
jgi:signal transduction histidine kinase